MVHIFLEQRGMTLIEVLVALLLLSLILLPLVGILTVGYIGTEESHRMTIATALAQQEMERFLAGIAEPTPQALLPDGYEVKTAVSDNGDGTEKVIVTVSWEGGRGHGGEITLISLRRR